MTDKEPRKLTGDEKLEQILYHLERLDRRDQWRTYGALIHTIMSFIPMLLLLGSLWYLYHNADRLLQQVASQAARQAAAAATQQGGDWMKQFQQMMGR